MTQNTLDYDGHDLEALFALGNYQRWIAESFAPYLGGSIAEFGAGMGAMSQWLVPMAERADLVEPSPNLVGHLKKRFRDDNRVRIVDQSLQDYISRHEARSLDAAVMVNLLEHIREDKAALSALRPLIKPAGYLLVFVPALPALYSDIDRAVGHHRRYTRRVLSSVVTGAGYDVVTVRYFDFLGILPWWLVHTIGRKRRFNPGLSTLYDRIGVPITQALEKKLPPPLGKNLLLVARPGNR